MLKILRAVTDKDWSGASRYNGHISADESVSRGIDNKLLPLPTHAGLDGPCLWPDLRRTSLNQIQCNGSCAYAQLPAFLLPSTSPRHCLHFQTRFRLKIYVAA